MVAWSFPALPSFSFVTWRPSRTFIVGTVAAAVAVGAFAKIFGPFIYTLYYEAKYTEETVTCGKMELIRLKGTGK